MRALVLLCVSLLCGCATATSMRWCEHFCGDRKARVVEQSEHEVSIAVCSCRSPVREEFEITASK